MTAISKCEGCVETGINLTEDGKCPFCGFQYPMSQTSKKILKILHILGFDKIKWLRVERTHAGRHQKSDGWMTWIATDHRGLTICGSRWPASVLTLKNTIKYESCNDGLEIGPR